MPDDSKRERRFSEEEVALIIKRAAELQQTEESEQESGGALSLPEIEQIAREAGIDPTLVRRAALGLDNPLPTNRPSPWLGAPTRLVFEKVVDGEIPIEEFETIIAEVRRTFGDNGLPSIIGRSLAWSSGMGGRRRAGMDVPLAGPGLHQRCLGHHVRVAFELAVQILDARKLRCRSGRSRSSLSRNSKLRCIS